MPWKDMIPASPDEKREAMEAVEKAQKRAVRYERKLAEARREWKDAIRYAYPRVQTGVMLESLGFSYQRLHEIIHEDTEEPAA